MIFCGDTFLCFMCLEIIVYLVHEAPKGVECLHAAI